MAKKKTEPYVPLGQKMEGLLEEYLAERMQEVLKSIDSRKSMVTQGREDRTNAICIEVAKDCKLLSGENSYPEWLGYLAKGMLKAD